jgi:hypothetical protein
MDKGARFPFSNKRGCSLHGLDFFQESSMQHWLYEYFPMQINKPIPILIVMPGYELFGGYLFKRCIHLMLERSVTETFCTSYLTCSLPHRLPCHLVGGIVPYFRDEVCVLIRSDSNEVELSQLRIAFVTFTNFTWRNVLLRWYGDGSRD